MVNEMERYKAGQTVFGVLGDDVQEIKLEFDLCEEEVKFYWGVDSVFSNIADAVYHINKVAIERCRKTLQKTDKIISDYYNL
jgi:hypothetical protein